MTSLIAVDTETSKGQTWSVQLSSEPHKAEMVVLGKNPIWTARTKALLENPDTTVIFHNALYDFRMLKRQGIVAAKFVDTMVMAYLLGYDSLKLKVLAFRHLGMEMRTFDDLVREQGDFEAYVYLQTVANTEWPTPDLEVVVDKTGNAKFKQPQSIGRKVKTMLKKVETNPDADLREKWGDMDGREVAEDELGVMPGGDIADVEPSESLDYACADADATFQLYPILRQEIDKWGLNDTLERDMGIVEMVSDMMENGMLLDIEHFHRLEKDFDKELDKTQQDMNTLVGGYINPNSSIQVVEALRGRGLKLTSSDAETLDAFGDDELVKLIQKSRKFGKLLSTYVRKFPKIVDGDNRLHTELSMTTAETGRLASHNPNLQNIPVRSKEGKSIRKGFMAGDGNLLLSIDFSQIEMRLAAHYSQDPIMIQAFLDGVDLHALTASRMFGIPIDQVDDKKHRYPAKRTGFGVLYGISGGGLLDIFHHEGITTFTEKDCDQFIVDYFASFPLLRDWIDETKAFVRRNGYIRDMFGRVRWIPEVYSALEQVRDAGLRNAVNCPIQSGAQGIIKEAMRQLTPHYKAWQAEGVVCLPLIQIHDELIFEVEEEFVPVIANEFKEVMEGVVELSMPLKADAEVGKNWAESMSLEEWYGA
jgi:DNA polymerase I-like protein with 3'-5' exonuclease and polymerase domains